MQIFVGINIQIVQFSALFCENKPSEADNRAAAIPENIRAANREEDE